MLQIQNGQYKYEVTLRRIPHSANSMSLAMIHSDYFWPLFDQWSRVVAAVSLSVSLFAIGVSLVIVKYDSEFNPRGTLLSKFNVTMQWLFIFWMPAQLVDTFRFTTGLQIHPWVCHLYIYHRQSFQILYYSHYCIFEFTSTLHAG